MTISPTQHKVNLFLKAADYLEQNPKSFEWGKPITCTCGAIVRAINPELMKEGNFRFTFYSEEAKYRDNYCPTTGLHIVEVVRVLFDAGFSPQELEEIEFIGYCTHKQFMNDYSIGPDEVFTHATHVINYFRKEAAIMQRLISLSQYKVKAVTPVSVSV